MECKRRHIKCDGAKPCGKCSRKGVNCIYHESDKKKRGPTAGKTFTITESFEGATKYYLDIIRKLSDELDMVKGRLAEKDQMALSRYEIIS